MRLGRRHSRHTPELRQVRPLRQSYPHLLFVSRLQVILRELLANLSSRGADHRILIRVVIGLALEYLEPDGPLFYPVRVVAQIRIDHVLEQGLTALAGPEMAT